MCGFIAMLAILALHCVSLAAEAVNLESTSLSYWIVDGMKFGTLAFFLISGFLLGDRFQTSPRVDYMRRRVEKVFVPWLFWLGLEVVCRVAHDVYGRGLRLSLSWPSVLAVSSITTRFLVGSSFWFVPNLFLAVTVLLIFRRHLLSKWMGGVLLAVNLLYVVNLYGVWMPAAHTRAWFAYVFYVWLGASTLPITTKRSCGRFQSYRQAC